MPVVPLPSIFISKTELDARISNYSTNKRPLLLAAQQGKDLSWNETNSVWFPKADIQTWLDEMDLLGADGLRIHLGGYDETATVAPGQLCLIMVLTREGEVASVHEDIIYENEPDFEDRQNASLSRSLPSEIQISEGESKQFNYGSPCPPIC